MHRDNGVDLRCGTPVQSLEEEKGWRITLADSASIEADVVLQAVGAVPNTDWLAGSGIELVRGAVLYDAFGATSAPDVWALGDVASWWHPKLGAHLRFEHWTDRLRSGACTCAQSRLPSGGTAPYDEVPYFWSDQYGQKLQCLGWPSPTDYVLFVGGRDRADHRFLSLLARDGVVTAVVGLGRPRDVMCLRPCLQEETTVSDAAARVMGR